MPANKGVCLHPNLTINIFTPKISHRLKIPYKVSIYNIMSEAMFLATIISKSKQLLIFTSKKA